MTITAEKSTTAVQPDFTLSAEALTKASQEAVSELQRRLDELAALPTEKRTFAATMLAFDRILGAFSTATAATTFPKYVSTDSAVREAAHDSETEISKLMVDIFAREDLYAVLKSCAPKAAELAPPDKKLLDWTAPDTFHIPIE